MPDNTGMGRACTPLRDARCADDPVRACSKKVCALHALRAFEPAERPIKRPQWEMTSLAGNLQHKAVGEAQRRLGAEVREGCSDHVGILNRKVTVIEEHFHRLRDLRRWVTVQPRG